MSVANPIPVDDFYTVKQVAAMFQVTTESVRLWINDEKLAAQKFGKNWRISRQAVVDFVEGAKR